MRRSWPVLFCKSSRQKLTELTTIFSFKPASVGLETPWHQEEAYWDNVNCLGNYLIVWIPLDRVSADSGCLQFIPRSHLGDVLRHRWEPRRPLIVDEPIDLSAAVACPVPPGAATVHHCRTLHYAGPNTTRSPRRVWLMAFHGHPSPREHPAVRPWLRQHMIAPVPGSVVHQGPDGLSLPRVE